jgi:hypothetical protein
MLELEIWALPSKLQYFLFRYSARILRPLVTFVEHYFFLIMNKQEYSKFNLIISYFALLVSNENQKAIKTS